MIVTCPDKQGRIVECPGPEDRVRAKLRAACIGGPRQPTEGDSCGGTMSVESGEVEQTVTVPLVIYSC